MADRADHKDTSKRRSSSSSQPIESVTSANRSTVTRVQKALHWFQYVTHGGLPLMISAISVVMLIMGKIQPDLMGGLLSLCSVYLLYLYSAPIIAQPRRSVDEVIKFTLPLLWITSIWTFSALLMVVISEITPITALIFGIILSLSPLYLIPLFFLIFTCLELSLIVAYNLSSGIAIYHILTHLIAGFTLPRLISPEWVLRSLYPRILEVNELPLSRRYFDAARFTPSHELTLAASEVDASPRGVTATSSGLDLPIHGNRPPSSSELKANRNRLQNLERGIRPEHQESQLSPVLETLTDLLHDRASGLSRRHSGELSALLSRHHDRAASFISRSLTVHLQLLRQQLHVETAVLLWYRPKTNELEVRAVDTLRDEWCATRFSARYGILEEALRESLVFNDPIEAHQLVPYYEESLTIGGLLSHPIHLSTESEAEGILLVDRSSNELWDHTDKATIRIVAEKISLDIETSQILRYVASEAIEIDRLCLCLKRLNEVFEPSDLAACVVRCCSLYEGILSAAYFQLNTHGEARLNARWVSPHLLDHDVTEHEVCSEGSIFGLEDSLLGQVLLEGIEKSTSIDPAPPSAYLPFEDWVLEQAAEVICLPLNDAQHDKICAAILLTADGENFNAARLSSLRLFFEQVEQKLALSNAHDRLRHLALRDGLTQLKNHMTFQAESVEMLKRAERDRSPLTFVLLDIDHFKRVNDTYGHPFGDEVLIRVAEALQQEVRDVDLVARYGGEEFALVLHATAIDQAVISIDRVRRRVEELCFSYEEELVRVTISIGFACYPTDSRQQDLLIDRADKALYQSKRNGRNQLTAWRDIAPDDQDSSVSWTRHPTSFHLPLEDHPSSPPLEVKGDKPAALLFELDDQEDFTP